jgi:ABC-2 type transport system permease protein
MTRLLRVAWQEYRRHVFNKRFILVGLLSVPLVILSMAGLVLLVISLDINTTPIGYVDASGLLADPLSAPTPEWPDKPIRMISFPDEASAHSALAAGQIQAYYLLPADYLTSGSLQVYDMGALKAPARSQFYDFLDVNLLRSTDPQVAARLEDGTEYILQSPDGSRSISAGNPLPVFIPMIGGILFIIAMFTTGGYLMSALVEEKENRTMEMIITSVSPGQFMTGKILGDISIGLTQIFLWSLCVLVPVFVLRDSIPFLKDIQIPTQTLLVAGLILLPSFVTVSALMAALGSTVSDSRESQQMVGIMAMPIWIPYMLTFTILTNPNSPLAVTLGILPLTAPLTMLIRDGFQAIPAWQIALSSGVQVLAAAAAIWLAGRTFRLGMLLYGRRLKLREIFSRAG